MSVKIPHRTISVLIGVLLACITVLWYSSSHCLSTTSRLALNTEGQKEKSGHPELLIQDGHTGGINCIAFSPDGKSIATGSNDETAKIWDAKNGHVLQTLTGHRSEQDTIVYSAPVTTLAFSPDGKLCATGSRDETIRLWDLATGRTTAVLKGHSNGITAVLFCDRGKSVLSAGEDGTVRLWDASTGAQKDTIVRDAGHICDISLNAAGTTLALAMDDYEVLLYDMASKKETGRLKNQYPVTSLLFSPKGNTLVAVQGLSISLWDVTSGKLTASLKNTNDDDRFVGADFTSSGNVVYSSSNGIFLWNPGSKKSERIAAYNLPITCVAVNPAGDKAAVGEANREGAVFDLASGKETAPLRGRASKIYEFAFSGDGTLLATGSMDGSITLWDLIPGKAAAHIGGQASVMCLALRKDGKELAAGYRDGMVRIWDVQEKKLTFEKEAHKKEVYALAFSPDGWELATGGSDRKVKIWNLQEKKLKASFTHPAEITSIAMSPDGRMLATGSTDGKVRQWNTLQRNVVIERSPQINHTWKRVWSVAFSPNGKQIAAGLEDGTVRIWETGLEEQEASLYAGCTRAVYSIGFSPDGQMLAMGMDLRTAVFDTSSWKEICRFEGDGHVAFCPGGKVLATGSPDASIRFWKIPGGRLLATAVVLDEGSNWAVTTPQGLFDGSPQGVKIIEWRIGNRVYALDQFYNDFYAPGLLSRIINAAPGESSLLRPPFELSRLKPPPRVSILSPKNNAKLTSSKVTIEVKTTELAGGTSRSALYNNGHRVPDSEMIPAGKNQIRYRTRLVRGWNRLRATAFNGDGSVESWGDEINVLCEAGSSEKPSLHILAVGIDTYKNGRNLRFANRDATSIAGFFKPGFFGEVKPVLLLNEKAGKDEILSSLQKIAQACQPQDTLICYLAGHGTTIHDTFYFLPYDAQAGNSARIQSTGISSTELGQALSSIPATRQVLILDSCHSGASTTSLGRILFKRDSIGQIRSQEKIARSSGTFLIAASTDAQYALEVPELGHGVLTYAVLSALGERAGHSASVNKEGAVTVNALLQYVSDEVPKLTQKYQGVRQDVVQFSTGQDFPLVMR